MKFKRVDKKTVRCIISEEEIIERGLNIEDLLHNGDKVQEFLNEVVDLAEAETGFKLTSGIQAVQAAFLPNRDIVFTFSDQPQGEGFEKALEQWKDLLFEAPKTTLSSQKNESKQEQTVLSKDLYLTIAYPNLASAALLCCHIPFHLLCESKLYKDQNQHYLLMKIKNITDDMRKTIDLLLGEYAKSYSKSSARAFYIMEHMDVVIEKNATDILKNIFS